MIYTQIKKVIINDLIAKNVCTSSMFVASDAPIKGDSLQIRPVWTFGDLDDFTNLHTKQNAILSLELYQKKFGTSNTYQDLSIAIRNTIKHDFLSITSSLSGNFLLKEISITNNNNDQAWNSKIINITIQLFGD